MDQSIRDISLEEEADDEFVATSTATLLSSEFPRRSVAQDDDIKNDEDDSGNEVDDDISKKTSVAENVPQQPLLSAGSFYGDSSSNAGLAKNVSVETLAGPDGIPYRSNMSTQDAELSQAKRLEAVSSRKKAIQNLPLPTFEMKLERLKRVEKFDAFSEDEEPVLKKDYHRVEEREPKCPAPVVKEEKILVYNVRKDGVPQLRKLPRWDMKESEAKKLLSFTMHHFPGSSTLGRKVSSSYQTRKSISVKGVAQHQPSIRKILTRSDKGKCGGLNENFCDTTPHQRDLFFVSYEELSPKEVAIIKGLWKSITFDLWTFGALTTINLFKLRGHITAQDPKATPDVMMECRFLWPHANQVMKALESVVMNLSRPSVSHKLVYEVGRKHWKLKIPITEDQKQLIINAFMYTFADHVHPRPNLNEMRTMRKFCSITMFLFADASRWNSEPLIPF